MNMKRKALSKFRRALGLNLTLNKLDELESRLISGLDSLASISRSNNNLLASQDLQILEGSIYAKFAIPIEYPPSRDFSPRWGYSRNKIQVLEDWFHSYRQDYSNFVTKMFAQNINSILLDHNPETPTVPAFVGGAICAFDSLAIYTMLMEHRPKIYCEIGSGMTTLFAKQSITDNGLNTRIISIDPEPRQFVDNVCDQIIRQPLESLEPEWFDQLEKGDILFLDGSHRSFMNSDVTVFFIDILPRIKPGVVIHIHDINLPYDYPESFKEWYWNEQYLLAIFLMASIDKVEPMLPTTYICRSEDLGELIKSSFVSLGSPQRDESWLGGGGGSFWFTKKYL
jgi:hypothetical protein